MAQWFTGESPRLAGNINKAPRSMPVCRVKNKFALSREALVLLHYPRPFIPTQPTEAPVSCEEFDYVPQE